MNGVGGIDRPVSRVRREPCSASVLCLLGYNLPSLAILHGAVRRRIRCCSEWHSCPAGRKPRVVNGIRQGDGRRKTGIAKRERKIIKKKHLRADTTTYICKGTGAGTASQGLVGAGNAGKPVITAYPPTISAPVCCMEGLGSLGFTTVGGAAVTSSAGRFQGCCGCTCEPRGKTGSGNRSRTRRDLIDWLHAVCSGRTRGYVKCDLLVCSVGQNTEQGSILASGGREAQRTLRCRWQQSETSHKPETQNTKTKLSRCILDSKGRMLHVQPTKTLTPCHLASSSARIRCTKQ